MATLKIIGIAYLTVVGCLVVFGSLFDVHQLNLDSERTVAAGISVAAEAGAAVAVYVGWRRRVLPRYAIGLTAFLSWVAFDNALEIHENLEQATGVTWEVLYLAFFVVGTTLMLALAWRVRGWPGILLVSALACWAGAVVLERLQWMDPFHYRFYAPLMIVEEVAELTAPLLIIGAVVLLLSPHLLNGRGVPVWTMLDPEVNQGVSPPTDRSVAPEHRGGKPGEPVS